jgi:hypothetical protein
MAAPIDFSKRMLPKDIIRAMSALPDNATVTFIGRDGEQRLVMQIDVETKTINVFAHSDAPLVKPRTVVCAEIR